MAHARSQEDRPDALRELSTALFSLRDALVELSLLLKDMQFETDREERERAGAMVRQLLETMRSNRGAKER